MDTWRHGKGRAALCLGAFVVGGVASAAPRDQPALESSLATTTVRAFSQAVLAPRVLAIEGTFARANHSLLAYCGVPGMSVLTCADLATHQGQLTSARLQALLTQQAADLALVGADLAEMASPPLGQRATHQMDHLLEDLALSAEQLAEAIQDLATTVPAEHGSPASAEVAALEQASASTVAYGPRVRGAVLILRRAEGWLETIDHETGARATLPGFEPGDPPIERQVGLP